MSVNEKRMLDRETLRSVIQQWNAIRLDIFELSEPNEVSFHRCCANAAPAVAVVDIQ